MRPIVIFGTNDFAETLWSYAAADHSIQIAALTVHRDYMKESSRCGLPVVCFEDLPHQYPPSDYDVLMAVGPSQTGTLRAEMSSQVRAAGYALRSFISPQADVSPHSSIGDNCVIFPGVIIEPFVTIGEGTVFWAGSQVAHHSTIGKYCFFAPGARISGRCVVEDHVFLGINSTVRDHVLVRSHGIIGAGAVIKADTQSHAVYSNPGTSLFRTESKHVPL